MENQYYTLEEIAVRLKVTRKAVREWIQRGELKAVMAGSVYRVTETAIQEFLNTPRNPRGRKKKVAETSATS